MAPKQFVEFLKWAQTYHREFAEYFDSLSEEAISPEAQKLLQYLSEHETALASMIKEYQSAAPEQVLQSWFKVSPDLSSAHHPDDINLSESSSPQGVLDAAIDVHEDLIRFYQLLDREALSPEIREAIENLLAGEKLEEIRDLRTQQ